MTTPGNEDGTFADALTCASFLGRTGVMECLSG